MEITELLLDEGADPNNPDSVTFLLCNNLSLNNLTRFEGGTNGQESGICA
jgi:hypothetical protein